MIYNINDSSILLIQSLFAHDLLIININYVILTLSCLLLGTCFLIIHHYNI